MGATTLVSVEDYLRTSYRPDCDYVDGQVVERNLGEKDHSKLQSRLLFWFMLRQEQLGIWAVVEQRVQVSARRFRVPDVCVTCSEPPDQIFRQPPHICIEVLSKDDSVAGMQERMDDYLAFGVRHVWLIDPKTRRAWTYTSDGSIEAKDGILRATNPDVILPLAELFAD